MLLFRDGDVPLAGIRALRIDGCGDTVTDAHWTTWDQTYLSWNHSVHHITDGRCEIEMGGTVHRLAEGHIHLIPGHQRIRRRTPGMRHRWINFNLGSMSEDLHIAKLGTIISLPEAAYKPWADALSKVVVLERAIADRGGAGIGATREIAAIEGMLLQAAALMSSKVGGALSSSDEKQVLGAAVSFLDQRYRNMPSLQEVARASGRSPNYLHGLFTAAFGVTPTAYARNLRMQDAVHLLTSTNLLVKDIAVQCGYEDQLYFSRVFTKYFGRSPNALRAERCQERVG